MALASVTAKSIAASIPLTDSTIRKIKPTDAVQKLRDGGGLYLLLRPDGAKWWRWDYRRPVTGKRNTLSLGTYPEVSLASVRERHAAARKLLAEGVDPGEQRKAQKVASLENATHTFEALAREHLVMRAKKLSTGSVKREQRLIEKDLAPYIGQRPVACITARDLLEVLRKVLAKELKHLLVLLGQAHGSSYRPDGQVYASLSSLVVGFHERRCQYPIRITPVTGALPPQLALHPTRKGVDPMEVFFLELPRLQLLHANA